jgi:hypothetical protein
VGLAVNKLMNLPNGLKLTRKQKEILELIYQYRFLNRIQIQAFLKHKDYKTINLWLKDLRAKHYLEWIYSTDFAEKTKPAIYYLGINGIRYLKILDYEAAELRKRYKDADRSRTYIDRCLLLADCCLCLEKNPAERTLEPEHKPKWVKITYFYETEAQYQQESFYHFLTDNDCGIRPNLCFNELENVGSDEPVTKHGYLLEIFDTTLPRYRLKKRLSNYVNYLDQEEAEWEEESLNDHLPVILFVCPRTTDLIYAKRKTRGLLAELWESDDEERPHIRFTTTDRLKQFGILAKEIWEEA